VREWRVFVALRCGHRHNYKRLCLVGWGAGGGEVMLRAPFFRFLRCLLFHTHTHSLSLSLSLSLGLESRGWLRCLQRPGILARGGGRKEVFLCFAFFFSFLFFCFDCYGLASLRLKFANAWIGALFGWLAGWLVGRIWVG
jgi:hypothetical protein